MVHCAAQRGCVVEKIRPVMVIGLIISWRMMGGKAVKCNAFTLQHMDHNVTGIFCHKNATMHKTKTRLVLYTESF